MKLLFIKVILLKTKLKFSNIWYFFFETLKLVLLFNLLDARNVLYYRFDLLVMQQGILDKSQRLYLDFKMHMSRRYILRNFARNLNLLPLPREPCTRSTSRLNSWKDVPYNSMMNNNSERKIQI